MSRNGVEWRWIEAEGKLRRQNGGGRRKGWEKEGGGLKMVIWNVAGVNRLGEEEWGYIKGHDIIGLTETWLKESQEERVRGRLENYRIRLSPARKKKGRGRPRGSVLWAIKKGIEVRGEEKQNEETIIDKVIMEGELWTIGVTYMREHRKENWKMIGEMIEEDPREMVWIGGNFNARTGEKAGEWIGEGMVLKDKTENKEGEEMLKKIIEVGLYIGNGYLKGDQEGQWAYLENNGRSIIDYVLLNGGGMEMTDSLRIERKISSGQLTVVVEMKRGEGNNVGMEKKEEERWVTEWSEAKAKESKEKVKGKEVENWKELKKLIKGAVSRSKRRIERKDIKGWWDEECWAEKRKLEELLDEVRKDRRLHKFKEYRK